jgi:hypothetical protein
MGGPLDLRRLRHRLLPRGRNLFDDAEDAGRGAQRVVVIEVYWPTSRSCCITAFAPCDSITSIEAFDSFSEDQRRQRKKPASIRLLVQDEDIGVLSCDAKAIPASLAHRSAIAFVD